MKRLIALFMFTLIGSIGIATLSYAAGSKLIQGDVLKVDGEFYVVQEMSGKEIRMHVDKTTHLEGNTLTVGDKIEAYVTDKGHARSIIQLTAAGKMTTPGSKIVEGDILKIDGEFYVVQEMSGKEIRMHVNETTYLEGTFKAGDMVNAYVTDKGHARSVYHITHVQPTP